MELNPLSLHLANLGYIKPDQIKHLSNKSYLNDYESIIMRKIKILEKNSSNLGASKFQSSQKKQQIQKLITKNYLETKNGLTNLCDNEVGDILLGLAFENSRSEVMKMRLDLIESFLIECYCSATSENTSSKPKIKFTDLKYEIFINYFLRSSFQISCFRYKNFDSNSDSIDFDSLPIFTVKRILHEYDKHQNRSTPEFYKILQQLLYSFIELPLYLFGKLEEILEFSDGAADDDSSSSSLSSNQYAASFIEKMALFLPNLIPDIVSLFSNEEFSKFIDSNYLPEELDENNLEKYRGFYCEIADQNDPDYETILLKNNLRLKILTDLFRLLTFSDLFESIKNLYEFDITPIQGLEICHTFHYYYTRHERNLPD